MSAIAIGLNLLLAVLLAAALFMGWRLNVRLKALRSSQDGFARAVGELNAAAQRAERGLAELRAASEEASELLGDRVEKARALAQRLERLVESAPQGGPTDADERRAERLGALIAAAREPRARPEPPERPAERAAERREPPALRRASRLDDDLFDEPEPLVLGRRDRS
ncbi:MAG: DUF6468 domain-containing protein [Phenylobacterium sp.]|uniref:DUF6468 domain-containing protein n=1 Tax=Phenylobacterium sp. TaxID=1871053 RepID=UPI00391DE60B